MERNLIQDAERIQELTNDRIPFDRACWIALYIQRITSGMSHEQAIAAEEQEKAAPEIPAPFLLIDDSDDTMHGTYDTEAEAIGAAEYDRLHAWTIYRAGRILLSVPATF